MQQTHKMGVTIITSTIRQHFIKNVFHNYSRQSWKFKELIIILNNDEMDLDVYKRVAKNYPNVRVFQLPEKKSLGECLNYAVGKAKYSYISKFDDDDYYGPGYIRETMLTFKNKKADIVGKSSFFFYLPYRKVLLLRRKWEIRPYTRCSKIAGATITFHKRVFRKVKFIRVPVGTDSRFLSACRKKGYSIYCTSPYHFAAIRRQNSNGHTWKISENKLLAERNMRVIRTNLFKQYVNRQEL